MDGMSTSGKGLAKLMALIEPRPAGRGSSFVELLMSFGLPVIARANKELTELSIDCELAV